MATLPPIPAPPPDDPADTRPTWKRYLATYLPWVVTVLMSFVATWLAAQPAKVKVQVERVEVPVVWLGEEGKPFVATGSGEPRPTHGWVRDQAVIDANLDPAVTQQFADTPAGKAAMGDEDVYLWRAVRKAAARGPPWYPNLDQKDVGCCVGCGWKHAADVCLAFQVANGNGGEWKPVSAESIYALSRVEIGKGQIRGDGSVGAWAKNAVEQYGVIAMQPYPAADLSEFSPARARSWGKTGLPNDLEATAKQHPVKAAALVKSWSDVKRSIQQGYPIAVCSDQGFTMQRDATGTCRPSGSWAHCMAIIGVRTINGNKEQGFVLNSWGDSAHTGPVSPADAPVAGFWADSSVIDRMVRQGDSFALAEIVGFPARKIDWGF